MKIGATFTWLADPKSILEKLSKGLRNKVLRIAMNKASSQPKAQIVSAAPKRFGFLSKSIRIRIVNYQNKMVWCSVIGATRAFVRKKGKYTRGKKKGQPKLHKPSMYSHLVDKGTKRARGRNFIRISFGKAFRRTFIRSLYEQIENMLPRKK